MKRILAIRPQPATVIASIALFVALGGVSYGFATGTIDSREIADNTIRGKDVRNNNLTTRDLRNNRVLGIDIRNRSLTRRDIANNTLTGDQIREAKLDQVPSAAHADSAGDAATLSGLGPSAFASAAQEGVNPLSLDAGVAKLGYLAPGYWRDSVGVVHLQGSVEAAAGQIATLPEGYRPAGVARFVVYDNTPIEVEPDGDIVVVGLGPLDISLDGVTFRAAAP